MNINIIIELLRKYQQEREVLTQLNYITSAKAELDKLIVETAKKVK